LSEVFVRAGGPDRIAVFAIRPVSTNLGGYGGAPPREITAIIILATQKNRMS
jgi:hypothetical protein